MPSCPVGFSDLGLRTYIPYQRCSGRLFRRTMTVTDPDMVPQEFDVGEATRPGLLTLLEDVGFNMKKVT